MVLVVTQMAYSVFLMRYLRGSRTTNVRLPYFFEGDTIEKTKFNVDKNKTKRTYHDIVFDSVLEMRYYKEQILPDVESGNIVELELQKPYILQEKFVHNDKTVQPIKYIADFFVKYKDGTEWVIDTKGMPDSVAKLKRKLFWFKYPDINYCWICYSKIDGGWREFEQVEKNRKERKKTQKALANNKKKED